MTEQSKQPAEQQQEITGSVKEQIVPVPSDYLAEVTFIKAKTINSPKGPSEVLEFTFKLLNADPNASSNIARGIAGFRNGEIAIGKPLYKWCSILNGADIGKVKDFKISSLVGKVCKVITENKPGTGSYSNFTFINVKEVLALKPKEIEEVNAMSKQPATAPVTTTTQAQPVAATQQKQQATAQPATTTAQPVKPQDDNFF